MPALILIRTFVSIVAHLILQACTSVILVAGHLAACSFFRKQPSLRPVYVPFSRESGIDWH